MQHGVVVQTGSQSFYSLNHTDKQTNKHAINATIHPPPPPCWVTLTGSVPPHRLRPPPQPAPFGRGPVALGVVPAVVQVVHAVKRAAVGCSGARAERVTIAAAAAPVSVEAPLGLPVVDMKGSRRPLLVHQ